MHAGRTGGNNNAGKFFFFDRLADEILPGVGTHVFVIDAVCNTWYACDRLRHFFTIHRRADVLAAMADKDSDS